MIGQSLDGRWSMRECGTVDWLPARVPGGVHPDLLAAGRIPDPFLSDEELRVQWVAERDWEYRRTFVPEATVAAAECQEIVFDGLDTLAEVELNGKPLGRADNMFRAWRWEVTGRLLPGENEIRVVFRSPTREAASRDAIRHLITAGDQLPGAPYLRKAPCHFGWDWGVKLPNVGLWQGVRVEGWSRARLADVALSQTVENGRATVRARILAVSTPPGLESAGMLEALLRVEHPDGRIDVARARLAAVATAADAKRERLAEGDAAGGDLGADLEIEIPDPQLWWPNGLGAQPLYRVDVELFDGERRLDGQSVRMGLRTIELRRDADEWGESFRFVVNGVPIFARGSNWIPADAFPGRIDPARLETLLVAAARANHNMVRVWGGGYYEVEAFYDACDRLGLLVWQDFMFACSVYPLNDAGFLANVRAEVSAQVRRLRHRTCLALWCGNNEMERGWARWGWDRPDTQDLKAAYLEFFGQTLPTWVAADDTATAYWPSSPSSGRPLEAAIGPRSGDEHEWRVWHGLEPVATYAGEPFRFVSEFGFESLPAETTIEEFAPDPADWTLGSPVLDHHQRCEGGNARILYYLACQFRLPHDFSDLVYLSQVLQAEAMRVGVEHWRRERDRCGGALYWQLDDCWPVSSWSSIDYYGRWKALHYAARRFFEPVLASCSVEGDEAMVHVTSDLASGWRGRVRWTLEDLDGRASAAGERDVVIAGPGTLRLEAVSIPAGIDRRRATVLITELLQGDARRALVTTLFVPDKHLALKRPGISRSFSRAPGGGRACVTLRSDVLARWAELSLDGADVVFDDNYVDLPAGRDVAIGFDPPPGWDMDRIEAAFRIRSIADTCGE